MMKEQMRKHNEYLALNKRARVPSWRSDVNISDSHGFPSKNLDLLSFINTHDLYDVPDTDSMSDIWTYVDPKTRHEYAIGLAFYGLVVVNVTVPSNSVVVGRFLYVEAGPALDYTDTCVTCTGFSWQDARQYGNYIYACTEKWNWGLTIIDMSFLHSSKGVDKNLRINLDYVTRQTYTGDEGNHNLGLDEEHALLFTYGTTISGNSYGVHVYDVRDTPGSPAYLGKLNLPFYVHDAETVTFDASHPDVMRRNSTIMFAAASTVRYYVCSEVSWYGHRQHHRCSRPSR